MVNTEPAKVRAYESKTFLLSLCLCNEEKRDH
jgi:hypothetical protein